MPDAVAAHRLQAARQVAHWRAAAASLSDFDAIAPAGAWRELESYLATTLRTRLQVAVERLQREGDVLAARLRAADRLPELLAVRRDVVRFRHRFSQVETVVEFYGEAVKARTTPKLAALLRGCDALASRSMIRVLQPLGQPTPPVLTYIDKGLGASILRAGVRLWDPHSLNPAAVIKITRHNLTRPTALIHEAGHQVAHVLSWNDELTGLLQRGLERDDRELAVVWSSWASEIAADLHAFAHTGYASVAALHDVVAGDPRSVHALRLGDPHPIPTLRVLLNVELCRRFYGVGPWDDLAVAWRATYPIETAPPTVRPLIERSLAQLPRIVELCAFTPMGAFRGRRLVDVVDPGRVSPAELARLAQAAGGALDTSTHWLESEALRMLALSGWRAATDPDRAREVAEQYERWMLRLGGGLRAAA